VDLKVDSYNLVASVWTRKGTADEWHNDVNSWEENFKADIRDKHGIYLKENGVSN
jgi:hypothetical protein